MTDSLVLRPLAPEDSSELVRIISAPEVRRWWGMPAPGFPLNDDPEAIRWTILVEGAVAGLIQAAEEPDPRYRYAAIDIFLDPALHGRGYGSEAVRRIVCYMSEERGHHRITIDPAVDNVAAIRAYTKAGFRPVGIMHRYERHVEGDGWHDGLLMEWVVDGDGPCRPD